MADRCAVEDELDATASGECKWSAGELRGGCCDSVERLGGEEGARATGILVAAGGTVPAMEVDGGHGERVGLAQGMHGRERESKGGPEVGQGWTYMARPRSTVDGDHSRRLGNARGRIGTLGHV